MLIFLNVLNPTNLSDLTDLRSEFRETSNGYNRCKSSTGQKWLYQNHSTTRFSLRTKWKFELLYELSMYHFTPPPPNYKKLNIICGLLHRRLNVFDTSVIGDTPFTGVYAANSILFTESDTSSHLIPGCLRKPLKYLPKTRFLFFLLKFLADTCPFWGPLVPLFWISGDVFSGFQSQSGFCLIRFWQLLAAGAQPVTSPYACAEVDSNGQSPIPGYPK